MCSVIAVIEVIDSSLSSNFKLIVVVFSFVIGAVIEIDIIIDIDIIIALTLSSTWT